MRITGVSASNVLSFACDDHAFQLDIPPKGLTVLVGPNGSGKTNVLRVVEMILDACRGNVFAVRTRVRQQRHRPLTEADLIRLDLSVELDPEEQMWLHRVWTLLLLDTPSLAGLEALEQNGKPVDHQVVLARAQDYVRWVVDVVGGHSPSVPPRGRFVLEVAADEMHGAGEPPWSWRWEGFNGFWLDLQGGTLYNPETLGQAAPQLSLTRVLAENLPADTRRALAEFLHGIRDDLPPLNPEQFLSVPAAEARRAQATVSSQQVGLFDAARPVWAAVTRRLGLAISDDLRLGYALQRLLRESVAVVADWQVSSQSPLAKLENRSLADLLSTGDVGAYLFALKNGSAQDREVFRKIHTEVDALTGHKLDCRLQLIPPSTLPVGARAYRLTVQSAGPPTLDDLEQGAAVADVVLDDLPIDVAGSGIAQTVYVVALSHLRGVTALVLDEPDRHFHPTLASQVVDAFRTGSSQRLVISHSPFTIPSAHLETVRRLYIHGGATVATAPFAEEEAKKLVLTKRGRDPDDRLFLFARVVVWVEGPHDAEALRVWLDAWAEATLGWANFANRFGVLVQACGGKTGVAPLMGLADRFAVPCVGVWDADVLASRSSKGEPTENNQTVLEQWRNFCLVAATVANKLKLDQESLIARLRQPGSRVHLMGVSLHDNLETLFGQAWPEWQQCAGREGYYGPIAFRWWAETHPWPDDWHVFLEPLFREVARLAGCPIPRQRRRRTRARRESVRRTPHGL